MALCLENDSGSAHANHRFEVSVVLYFLDSLR